MQSRARYFSKSFLGVFLLGLIIIFSGRAHANQWTQTYGGAGTDEARVTQQTTDGGYIVGGIINSFGAGDNDAYVSKLDASGNIIWQKTYGGAGNDGVASIQQTTDGGYIVGGWTTSFGAGAFDFWILKLDASGTVIWQKTYGGGSNDLGATAIQEIAGGGYIMVGPTQSFGAGNTDVWVLKLDASGNVIWQNTYGAGQLDYAYSIQQTADLGYIVAGRTTSSGNGLSDVWVLKLDAAGNVTWQKTYGGASADRATSIQQTTDGGYIVSGYTASFGAGGNDAWVLKLDASGNIPNCGAQGISSATVNVTGVVPAATVVAAVISAAGSPNTIATITNTAMTQILACFFADPVAVAAIPTLSEWGMILLAGLLGLFGVGGMRRRSRVG